MPLQEPANEIVEENDNEVVEVTSVVNPPVAHDLDAIEGLDEEAEENTIGGEENLDDSDEDSEEEVPQRKSARQRTTRKILTYSELGKPSYSTSC